MCILHVEKKDCAHPADFPEPQLSGALDILEVKSLRPVLLTLLEAVTQDGDDGEARQTIEDGLAALDSEGRSSQGMTTFGVFVDYDAWLRAFRFLADRVQNPPWWLRRRQRVAKGPLEKFEWVVPIAEKL